MPANVGARLASPAAAGGRVLAKHQVRVIPSEVSLRTESRNLWPQANGAYPSMQGTRRFSVGLRQRSLDCIALILQLTETSPTSRFATSRGAPTLRDSLGPPTLHFTRDDRALFVRLPSWSAAFERSHTAARMVLKKCSLFPCPNPNHACILRGSETGIPKRKFTPFFEIEAG